MTLSHIVAASENNVIGNQGQLPWHIPEDMHFFKEKTKGKAIIMGRKTYESIGHALPDRLNVIVTRQKDYQTNDAQVAPTLDEAIEYCKNKMDKYGDEIFIIGGGEIYEKSMDIVDIIYLTRIHKEYPGDTYYPNIDKKQFAEVERRDREEPVPFSFLTYARK